MTSVSIPETLRQRIMDSAKKNEAFEATITRLLDHYEHCPYAE